MMRAELCHYFRHVGLEPRKDMKKYLTPDSLKSKRISALLAGLLDLTALTRRHSGVVRQ
jgi:hypothetical protein